MAALKALFSLLPIPDILPFRRMNAVIALPIVTQTFIFLKLGVTMIFQLPLTISKPSFRFRGAVFRTLPKPMDDRSLSCRRLRSFRRRAYSATVRLLNSPSTSQPCTEQLRVPDPPAIVSVIGV